MGKWFSHNSYIIHKNDLKVHHSDDPFEIEYYYSWVQTIANTFPKESIAIGCLTQNDLIQAGYIGLWEAWNKVDWARIEASNNPQGELWSYLKIRIKYAIRQEIDVYANEIKIPEREIREARRNLKPLDKTLVNIFPNFFDEEVVASAYSTSWLSIQLEEIIEDYLIKVEPDYIKRKALLAFYGIGRKKPHNQKTLARWMKKTPQNVQKIIERTKNKLKTKEFEEIIENFYENES